MDLLSKMRSSSMIMAFLVIPVVSQVDCTKVYGILCSQLKAAPHDSIVFEIGIFLKGPPTPTGDSAYYSKLEKELNHLFTTYDLRDSLNQRFLTPREMDWTIQNGYYGLFAAKKTILDLLNESYVVEVVSSEGVGPAASFVKHQVSRIKNQKSINVLVNGRRVRDVPKNHGPIICCRDGKLSK